MLQSSSSRDETRVVGTLLYGLSEKEYNDGILLVLVWSAIAQVIADALGMQYNLVPVRVPMLKFTVIQQ